LDYLKQKEDNLKKIIPEIEKIQNKPKEEKKVSISEGLNSVKNILLHFLDSKKPLDVYGTPIEALELLGGFTDEFHKLRIEKKILMRYIFGIDALKRVRELNEMEYTKARYLPSSYNSKISTNICEDKVVLILWDMPVSAITIENKLVAETYRNYFEILWDAAKISY
tara:strand:+ start:10404 stop:10904 length:501 start_codon:yes stop_codon:yes gene_type:complete